MAHAVISEATQHRIRTWASVGLIVGGIVPIISMAVIGDNYTTVTASAGTVIAMIAVGLAAVSVTALRYGEGDRGLGLAGIVSSHFLWIALVLALIWTAINWESVYLAQTGAAHYDVFDLLFGQFAGGVLGTLIVTIGIGMAALAVGLKNAQLAHHWVARLVTAAGILAAVADLAVAATGTAANAVLVVSSFSVLGLVLLGISLYVKRGHQASDIDAGQSVSA